MKKMTQHPLRSQESAIKRALVLSGFDLFDDGQSREVVPPEWNLYLSKAPYAPCEPILLEAGNFILRTDLLSAQLAGLKGPLPIKKMAAGVVYDAVDAARPNRTRIQGVWADERIPTRLWMRVWETVVREAFGLGATFSMTPVSKDAHRVDVQVDGASFTLTHIARATDVAYALLGLSKDVSTIWLFDIDVDSVACGRFGLESRDQLYRADCSYLDGFVDDAPTYGNFFIGRAVDLLRARGFTNFYGPRFYDFDCYKRMHMIQEGWDKNNDGMRLVEPMGSFDWLPTVLTPSLEEALAANYRAGEKSCRLFELGHAFVPYSDSDKDRRERSKNKKYDRERGEREPSDKLPNEKICLSLGAYGPDLDEGAWVETVSEFLDAFGVKEHYFMDTMQAIAYKTLDCHVIMNDKMRYLMSNFGSIHKEALKNYGIGVPAFMAQFEFAPIEQEAAWEMIFVPVEYR